MTEPMHDATDAQWEILLRATQAAVAALPGDDQPAYADALGDESRHRFVGEVVEGLDGAAWRLRVDVEMLGEWRPVVRVYADELGLTADQVRNELELARLQHGIGVPDDTSSLDGA